MLLAGVLLLYSGQLLIFQGFGAEWMFVPVGAGYAALGLRAQSIRESWILRTICLTLAATALVVGAFQTFVVTNHPTIQVDIEQGSQQP